MLALDGQVLRHHRCDACLLLGGAGGGGGSEGILGKGLGQGGTGDLKLRGRARAP